MIGIILGDGYLFCSNQKYGLIISLNLKDEGLYIQYVKNLMEKRRINEIEIKIPAKNEAEGNSNCLRKPTIKIGAVSTKPDIIIVAPVSPRLLVKASIAPAIIPSFIIGKVIVRKTVSWGEELFCLSGCCMH